MKPKSGSLKIEKWIVISGYFQGHVFNGFVELFKENGQIRRRHKRVIDCDNPNRSYQLRFCEKLKPILRLPNELYP